MRQSSAAAKAPFVQFVKGIRLATRSSLLVLSLQRRSFKRVSPHRHSFRKAAAEQGKRGGSANVRYGWKADIRGWRRKSRERRFLGSASHTVPL